MSKAPKTIRFVTPVGVAVYPKISAPDTQGQFADGKYKTDVDFGSHTDALIKKFEEAAKAWGVDVANIPVVDQKDRETKKPTGKKLVRFKSKFRPGVFDSKKVAIPSDVTVGGGTELRIDTTMFPWAKGGKSGVSLRLGPVQISNLIEGGDSAANFDEIEGYEYDGADAPEGSEGFDTL
jgi:hypothetical protein